MKTRTDLLSATIAALALWSATSLHGQLIVNGTFDLVVPSNDTGGGWTSANQDGNGGWRNNGGNLGASFIINEGGQPERDPSISQLVSGLSPGQSYLLTGDYASAYSISGDALAFSFAVDVDGVNKAMLGRPGGEGVYGSFSIPLVANDSDLLIAFRAEINGDDSSFQIDNIALTIVPEPSRVALLVLGGIVLLGARKKGQVT